MTLSTTLIFISLVYAGGIALGLLLAVLLLANRSGNQSANRWLAAMVAALALLTFGSLMEDTRLVLMYPHLGYVTDWLIFAVGPCVWLYVRRLTGEAPHRRARLILHFLPAIALILIFTPFYVLGAEQKRAILESELAAAATGVNIPLLAAGIQILAYWVASLRTLVRYAVALREQCSSIERQSFGWLRIMLIFSLAMWIVWMLGQVLGLSWAELPNAISVPFSLYVLAFLGLRQPAVFGPRLVPPAQRQIDAFARRAEPTSNPPESPERYRRDLLDDRQVAIARARLETLMETEKPWLENELTLGDLAARLDLSTHHLSQLINGHLGQSFYDFINSRRVAEVQRCLRDPAYAGQPILDIALASGFNSKTAFNAAFKALVGQTPSQYRRAVQAGAAKGEPAPGS